MAKRSDSKEDFSLVAYTLGIMSIVMALLTSFGIGGIVFGIIGLNFGKRQKTSLSNKAIKLNKLGLILGIIIFVVSLGVMIYLAQKGLTNLTPQF